MSKSMSWWFTIFLLIFGISDRTFNAIINDYSIDSLVQILVGVILFLLIRQLYPHN